MLFIPLLLLLRLDAVLCAIKEYLCQVGVVQLEEEEEEEEDDKVVVEESTTVVVVVSSQ